MPSQKSLLTIFCIIISGLLVLYYISVPLLARDITPWPISAPSNHVSESQPPLPDTTSSQALPTATPTIFDPDAPDPQECPGYKASNVIYSESGITAELTIAGPACNAFGTDISDLIVEVSYQAKERLNMKIQPKYIGAANSSWFILDERFLQQPGWDGETTQDSSDLQFTWSNDPTFQFAISRKNDGVELFSTYGRVIVYEDQFIELLTNMVHDYNVYGLAESIHNFRLGNNRTQTLFNTDTADIIDGNSYSSHPFYQETRHWSDKSSTAHGVYARNAHAQEWLLRERTLTYRAIGGSLDFYFLSGQETLSNGTASGQSSALEVFRQYQRGCVGLPAMQTYWALGFHQCHWGYTSISHLRDVVNNYSAAGIPLESIWNDIDVYDRYRIFTNDPVEYASDDMHDFVEYLHSRRQHYVPIQDANVYVPNPANESDIASYPSFSRGAELDVFIRDAESGNLYVGENWPGYSVWVDWLSSKAQAYWTDELRDFHDSVPFDGLWIDLNEIATGCSFSCGNVLFKDSHPVPSLEMTEPTMADPRKLNYPPYTINNAKPTKQIFEDTIAMDAVHNDEQGTREYDVHSLWSVGMGMATYNAMQSNNPGTRPFIVSRSTFAGSGQYVGHWGGDNESKWGAMFLSISQALMFQMSGIPLFGVDTCGFAGNTTEELCARWMELSAFFPFYRNHYSKNLHPQEAYVWSTVAEASRRAIAIRYSLLTYLYTLFYYAHTRGDTVMRALAWEFPNDVSLRETDTQFLLGPSLLVTPVLEPGATTVKGVFPGIEEGTRWFDWYTHQELINVQPHENVTLAAPLEHVNLHIRGGSILALQQPSNTTRATKLNPYSLLVAPDINGSAIGSLYLDDGESIDPSESNLVEFSYAFGRLVTHASGTYHSSAPLANITILGVESRPEHIVLEIDQRPSYGFAVEHENATLEISGLERTTQAMAWEQDLSLQLS